MRNKVIVYFNKTLLWILIVFPISIPFFYILLYGQTFIDSFHSTPFDAKLLVAFVYSANIGTCFLGAIKVSTHYVLTEDTIEIRQWFKKKRIRSYKDYPYVMKSYYLHYGIPAYYILISNERFSTNQLMRINGVRCTPNTIRIRYTKKNYERLLAVTPPRIARSIEAQFKNVPIRWWHKLAL